MARVTRSSAKASAPAKAAPTVTKKKVEKKPKKAKAAEEPVAEAAVSSGKVVTIEACKSWGAFRTRAGKIVKAVGSKAKVEVNKEKPGKGNFIITVSGCDEPIVKLEGMARPFTALKALNFDDVIVDVIKAIDA